MLQCFVKVELKYKGIANHLGRKTNTECFIDKYNLQKD